MKVEVRILRRIPRILWSAAAIVLLAGGFIACASTGGPEPRRVDPTWQAYEAARQRIAEDRFREKYRDWQIEMAKREGERLQNPDAPDAGPPPT